MIDADKITNGNIAAMVFGLILWAVSVCLLIIAVVTTVIKNIKGKFNDLVIMYFNVYNYLYRNCQDFLDIECHQFGH